VRAQHLLAALESGDASWTDVDRAVEHIVATLLRFDAVLSRPAPSLEVVGSARHRALAREVAARSVVLLRNEPAGDKRVLPLDDATRPVAVIGILAETVNTGDVGSSDVWDLKCVTVLDGLRAGFDDVRYDDGTDAERAADVAGDADVAIVVVGTTSRDEGEYIGETDASLIEMFPPGDEPHVVALFQASIADLPQTTKPSSRSVLQGGFGTGGDRTSLRLTESDVALIRAVAAANPRTVVAIQGGSAVIPTEWIDAVPAVVQSWYGGSQAGPGLGDVLLGVINPSARLPFSIPVDEADLPTFDRDARTFRYDRWHGWWHLARNGTAPLFPFGFGLSYSAFSLADVGVVRAGDTIDVRGTVRNDGARDGADVVQVYAERPAAGAPHRLVGFARVEVSSDAAVPFHVAVPLDSNREIRRRIRGSRHPAVTPSPWPDTPATRTASASTSTSEPATPTGVPEHASPNLAIGMSRITPVPRRSRSSRLRRRFDRVVQSEGVSG
jgi:beta-glucosidase